MLALDAKKPVQSKKKNKIKKYQIQSITSQLHIYIKKLRSYSKCNTAFHLHPREYIKTLS